MFVILLASDPPALCDPLAFAKGSVFNSYKNKVQYKTNYFEKNESLVKQCQRVLYALF